MEDRTINEQNELNQVEAFYNRDDIKDKSMLTKYHLWLEDRGVATLSWHAAKDKEGNAITYPSVEGVNRDRYPIFQGIHNKWIAELARRESAKKVKV